MKGCLVAISPREVDYIGTVNGFTLLPEFGLFAKKTRHGVELIAVGVETSTHISISRK